MALNPLLERNLIFSLLKFTKKGYVERRLLYERGGFPKEIMDRYLAKLRNLSLVHVDETIIRFSSDQRLRLAIKALSLGSDVEALSGLLEWNEFESLSASAFRANGFKTLRGMRFSWDNRRWEIDVIGYSKPLMVCIDCKHWRRALNRSAINKIVELHVKRVEALSEALPSIHSKMRIEDWKEYVMTPIIVSLHTTPLKFCQEVPVVPIFQLQNFITELPSYLLDIKHFKPEFKAKEE